VGIDVGVAVIDGSDTGASVSATGAPVCGTGVGTSVSQIYTGEKVGSPGIGTTKDGFDVLKAVGKLEADI